MIRFEEIKRVFSPEYDVIKEIGRGGMAIVYMAVQKSLSRTVALKVIPINFSQDLEFSARFKHEALESAKLSHQNIITIYDTGEKQGYQYISMKYLSGRSLQQRIREKGNFNEDEFINVFSQLLDALHHAHAKGIIHRDIKSSNIIFDDKNKPIIMDFGISKSKQSSGLTIKGSFIGTLEYASPEQIESSDNIDHRADIYSIGIVGFEMLSGKVPFEGSINTVISKVLNEEPRSLKSIATLNNPNLSKVIHKAISKKPSDRFNNADEFKHSLTNLQKSNNNTKSSGNKKYINLILVLFIVLSGLIILGYYSYKNKRASHEQTLSTNPTDAPVNVNSLKKTGSLKLTDIGLEMVKISGNKFVMGNEFGDTDESPSHKVTINDFFMAKTEVTESLWDYIMSDTRTSIKKEQIPKTNISWDNVQIFLRKLNKKTNLSFRLPTEEEWEYAAKGGIYGTKLKFPLTYSGSTNPNQVAWFNENAGGAKHTVKAKKQNQLDLYDMSGNVWEWCNDSYSKTKYMKAGGNNQNKSDEKVIRGGGFLSSKADLRTSNRDSYKKHNANDEIGFRIVASKLTNP